MTRNRLLADCNNKEFLIFTTSVLYHCFKMLVMNDLINYKIYIHFPLFIALLMTIGQ
jgi:hypothetical protein